VVARGAANADDVGTCIAKVADVIDGQLSS
jgi:hypothetical protein